MPPIVFLQYIDAIALNEDVKYYSKGKNLKHQNTGGKNNYLTYVMITAVMTGDLPISAIASKLLRSNVDVYKRQSLGFHFVKARLFDAPFEQSEKRGLF